MPKWTKKLSTKQFIISQILILIVGFAFMGGLYYILNIQYQKPYKPYSQSLGPITSPPKTLIMDLLEPGDDTLVYSSSIIISGKTAPNSQVLITTDSEDLVLKSSPDGTFSTIINLKEGVNRITAVVFDVTGDWRSTERTVYYSKEKI